MENFFKNNVFTIEEKTESPFMNKYGVYQDGTTPMYRDTDGRLWAMSGHTHMGHIGMFCGTCLDDLKEVYPIDTAFDVGRAGSAFCGVKYPEDILPRGSIWPFGLYICPGTHRFFCFFHNESGWNGHGTGYVIDGKGDGEPDFRHIGLMHSDDEGRTWTFDRWVLTSEQVCFSEKYIPDRTVVKGQKKGLTCLGCGDFSLFTEPDGEYIYLYYNLLKIDSETGLWQSCDVYAARTRKRSDGVMGDFVKYYNGEFCEAGNLGKESPIVFNAWHPRVVYSKDHKIFGMSSTHTNWNVDSKYLVDGIMELRTSPDMLCWSEPRRVIYNGTYFGNHYTAIVSEDNSGQPYVVGDSFSILSGHNGTDVMRFKAKIG